MDWAWGWALRWHFSCMGSFREALGNASFLGNKFVEGDGILVFILSPGAFLALGYFIALMNRLKKTIIKSGYHGIHCNRHFRDPRIEYSAVPVPRDLSVPGGFHKVSTAVGMSAAVVFVIALATMVTWLVNKYVLVPFDITFLQTISFILIIAALVQMVEIILKKISPPLYQALGIYLPLITTNCAVLGVALLVQAKAITFCRALCMALPSPSGLDLPCSYFPAFGNNWNWSDMPKGMKGIPIALVTAGIFIARFYGLQRPGEIASPLNLFAFLSPLISEREIKGFAYICPVRSIQAMEDQKVIFFRDVPIYQREIPIFSGASLEVKQGEFVYLIGKTGSGKSSLLKAMYAELPVHAGEANVAGYDLINIRNKEVPFLRRKLGIIFQDFSSSLTVLPKIT